MDVHEQLLQTLAGKVQKPVLVVGTPGGEKVAAVKEACRRYWCSGTAQSDCSCADCFQVENDCHPQLYMIRPEKGSVGVDEVRLALQVNAETLAGRVVLLDQADTLTVQAANAVLKTLEESLNVCWFLTTDRPKRVLRTVRSRCVVVQVPPSATADVLDALQAVGVPEALWPFYVGACRGSVGYAVRLFSLQAHTIRDCILGSLLDPRDVSGTFSMLDSLAGTKESGIPRDVFVHVLNVTLKDLILLRHAPHKVVSQDCVEKMRAVPDLSDRLPALSGLVELVDQKGINFWLHCKVAFLPVQHGGT